MQAFCETRAPHLFYILICTIVGADGHSTSERHSHLQQQRMVALLHMLQVLQQQRMVALLHMLPYFRYLLQITMYLPTVLPFEK